MTKKTRLSFSAVSIEHKKEEKFPTHINVANKIYPKTENKITDRKKGTKSSTFQYSKFNKKQGRGMRSPLKNQSNSINEVKIPPLEEGKIRIIPLGGAEEIGKNMTAIEIGDDIIVVDAGMHFSNEDTPGVDYVIPNTTYLEEHKDKIRGLFITHGHLDHIGGIPIVLSRIGNPKVYSRNLTVLMIKKRQAEFPHLPPINIEVVEKNEVVTCGKIKIRIFGVTHTIPDSMGIIIETKHGWIVTPGDYKLDQINGVVTDNEEKEYSIFDKANVLLLMTDSTNVENEGFSLPEIKVHEGLDNLLRKINGRIIIAAFSSQITRLAHVVKTAESMGKKIAIDGRSMKTNIDVAIEAGFFKPKKDTIIPIEEADKYPPNRVVILMTGSQGEEFAALSRAANKSHKKFGIKKGDTIILSASVVPGNELKVQRIKDNLSRQGVKIISYRTAGEDFVHATGHGNKEDIKWLHRKTHPRFFIPIHGNHFMLELHKELAMELGMPEENIIVPDNGSIIEISADGKKMVLRKEKAPSAPMMVDGLAISDVQDVVIRDRVMLAQDGMFVVIALLDQNTGKLKKSPDLISRGFVYLKENQELLRQVRIIIKKSVEDTTQKMNQLDLDYIKNNLGETISKYLYQKTAKRPLVIPVVLTV
ncbi:MAG TPA: ribonuclease J [Candidatus Paceibacterota bacterium]|nr:ribonuclease J [Candidatus Paceibacterota bacterium]HPT18337.1 ribonuclease J [Candidatus Paceibacterota bacterium]